MTLPFQENLCRGTKLMVSAWVKSADENSENSENSAMLLLFMVLTQMERKLRCVVKVQVR